MSGSLVMHAFLADIYLAGDISLAGGQFTSQNAGKWAPVLPRLEVLASESLAVSVSEICLFCERVRIVVTDPGSVFSLPCWPSLRLVCVARLSSPLPDLQTSLWAVFKSQTLGNAYMTCQSSLWCLLISRIWPKFLSHADKSLNEDLRFYHAFSTDSRVSSTHTEYGLVGRE